ncbi:MAG: imidazole glycerol phosphate synthase subunit HisF [Bacteroidales bacterium]|jgi:cyclase|nr:imidazole glycerol phosphate synthase subunit HisF [Bacteroidales bacterium]
MLTKRIIPCLDIMSGRTVKGVNFIDVKDAGNPVDLAIQYVDQGADELVFLDITATLDKHVLLTGLIKQVARHLTIPFTVGGGINSVQDVSGLLNAGADKVSVNTSAVNDPSLIENLAGHFGNQCIVLAMDVKLEKDEWYVYTCGGRKKTRRRAIDWAREAVERGAGEILLTSMNHDGTKNGFAIEITRQISELVNVPVIASGGAGSMEHFAEVFTDGKADAALAASVFHYREIRIPSLKKYLKDNFINVRL